MGVCEKNTEMLNFLSYKPSLLANCQTFKGQYVMNRDVVLCVSTLFLHTLFYKLML